MRVGTVLITAFCLLICPLVCPACGSRPTTVPTGPGIAPAQPAKQCCCGHCQRTPAPDESPEPTPPEPDGCPFDCICKGAVVETQAPIITLASIGPVEIPESALPAGSTSRPEPSSHPPPIAGRDLRTSIQSLTC